MAIGRQGARFVQAQTYNQIAGKDANMPAAEARAEKTAALLRAKLLPHLARSLAHALVQRLLAQRSEVLSSQQKAEREVADYVIVHELLHFSVPNHGKLWKSLMRAHLGDYEKMEQRLRDTWPPG